MQTKKSSSKDPNHGVFLFFAGGTTPYQNKTKILKQCNSMDWLRVETIAERGDYFKALIASH